MSSLKFQLLYVRAFLRGGCFRDLIVLYECYKPRNSVELFRKQVYQRNCFANKSRIVLTQYSHLLFCRFITLIIIRSNNTRIIVMMNCNQKIMLHLYFDKFLLTM